VSGAAELASMVDVPVLAEVAGDEGLARDQRDQDDVLVASLVSALDGTQRPVVLVTSALGSEGRAGVVARLGRALALTGYRALVVSADLERSKLHDELGLSLGLGLTDLLEVLERTGGADLPPELLERATNNVLQPREGDRLIGRLSAITAGTKPQDPGPLVSGRPMERFVQIAKGLSVDYVLVDGPSLLGPLDSQTLSRAVDYTLLVSCPRRLPVRKVGELREKLDGLADKPAGLLALGR